MNIVLKEYMLDRKTGWCVFFFGTFLFRFVSTSFVIQRDCEFPAELVQWADACLLVYSITDHASFDTARRLLGRLVGLAAAAEHRGGGGATQQQPVLALLANKADLEHLRLVSGCQLWFIIAGWGWKQFLVIFDKIIMIIPLQAQ